MTGGENLLSVLRDRIRKKGPITFQAFMEAALYEPGLGRYQAPSPPMGPEGDYITSPEVDPAFGRLTARALAEMAGRIRIASPHGDPFTIVEMGPGTGALARDLLVGLREEHSELAGSTRYILVEPSKALRSRQEATLQGAGLAAQVGWQRWDELLRGGPFPGCILANEFLDALPVHLVECVEGELKEIFIGLDPGGLLQEVHGEPSRKEIPAYLEDLGIRLEEGQRAEVNLAALAWIREAGSLLKPGYAVIVDYGHEAEELFSERHFGGTLLGYRRHRLVVDPLEAPGEGDLTSHVDFTSLVREARRAGFESRGMTSQRRFLVSMGLAEMIAGLAMERPEGESGESVRRRFAMHALMSTSGMGETFKVLLLGRGVSTESLRCLGNPFRDPVEGRGSGV